MRCAEPRTIHVFEPTSFWGRGHSETCYRICSHWPGYGQDTKIHTTLAHRSDPAGVLHPVLPHWLPAPIKSRIHNFLGQEALRCRSEAAGLQRVQAGDICYFWPGTSNAAMQAARNKGATVVLEFINTHVAYAKHILDAECDRLGIPSITTDLDIEGEEQRLALADFAFAPGPFVGDSIRRSSPSDVGILETSYGAYVPKRAPDRIRQTRPMRFLFVGLFGVRKGAHTLLDAWKKTDIEAELYIVGTISPEMQARLDATEDDRLRYLGYRADIGAVYSQADVFVFPSLEEGGPQVTYEAASYGLPLVVTAMGGGRIADVENAIIVPSSDSDALANAFVRLNADRELAEAMGRAARSAALQFDWPEVARQRLALLDAAIF